MIDAATGLIIERDNSEGTGDRPARKAPAPRLLHVPAKFKRIYKIDFRHADVGKRSQDRLHRPDGHRGSRQKARQPRKDGKLAFPFFTIENVDGSTTPHIIVGNDNNLPFSSGRALGKSDDNEFMILKVADFLKAK